MKPSPKTLSAALALALVAACTNPLIKDTRALLTEGRTEEALASLEKATREDPQNHFYRSEYFRLDEPLRDGEIAQAEIFRTIEVVLRIFPPARFRRLAVARPG